MNLETRVERLAQKIGRRVQKPTAIDELIAVLMNAEATGADRLAAVEAYADATDTTPETVVHGLEHMIALAEATVA